MVVFYLKTQSILVFSFGAIPCGIIPCVTIIPTKTLIFYLKFFLAHTTFKHTQPSSTYDLQYPNNFKKSGIQHFIYL
jgi:hypothetical protein